MSTAHYAGYLVPALGIAVLAEQVSHRAVFVLPLLLSPILFLMARRFEPRPAASGVRGETQVDPAV